MSKVACVHYPLQGKLMFIKVGLRFLVVFKEGTIITLLTHVYISSSLRLADQRLVDDS